MFQSKQIKAFLAHDFDFSNQHKNTYDDWFKAFETAVTRNVGDSCFIGLSSGYDSGALSCEMARQGVDFKAYSILSNEDVGIINKRGKYVKNHQKVKMSKDDFLRVESFLMQNLENARYVIRKYGRGGTRIVNETILEDKASKGLAFMCKMAREQGRKIYISTQGADEIMADYAFYETQSEFKGEFPEDLYEWHNFKGSCNQSYLMKEERVPALFGIKTRFPFIDIDLAQEFLWLSVELKNKHYKAPLYEYLKKNDVPFEQDVKRGFNPI